MLKTPSRASTGNRAYTQKPFKAPRLPADNRSCYSIACVVCKAVVNQHCVDSQGFWEPPHYARYTAVSEAKHAALNVECSSCGAPKGDHCLSVYGKAKGFPTEPHPARRRTYKESCEASRA